MNISQLPLYPISTSLVNCTVKLKVNEQMIGILDLVSAGVIVGSALVMGIKLRSELKKSDLSPKGN
jgi:hypothetical protein